MDLVQPTRELLETLRAPVLAPFLAEWPEDTTQRRAVAPPVSLPVLSWLNQATAAAPALCKELVTDIAAAAPELTWKQTYTAAQDEGWRAQRPGTVIHHPTHIPHAMRTSDEALLALYLWRSDNLRQKAQLLAARHAAS